jgi:hypothetical protein
MQRLHQAVNDSPFAEFPDNWTVNVPGVTDMAPTINEIIRDYKSRGDPLRLNFRGHKYRIGETIYIDSPVVLAGQTSAFLNDYINDELLLSGTVLEAVPGLNDNVITVTGRMDGLLPGSYPRSHVTIRDLMIHGRRSDDQAPTAIDLNSKGNGLAILGASYVLAENLTLFRCAGDGLLMASSTNRCLYSEDLTNAVWVKTGAAITADNRAAPDGTLTMDRVVTDGTTVSAGLRQDVAMGSTIADTSVTASIWLYSATAATFQLRLSGAGTTTEAENFPVTLQAGVMTRVSATKKFTAAADGSTVRFQVIPTFGVAEAARTFWAWGGQVAQGSSLLSYRRTTAATAANSSNNISLANIVSIGNAGNGMSLAGGDSTATRLIGGYNGGNGLTASQVTCLGGLMWNNVNYGISINSFPTNIVGFDVYDSQKTGVLIVSGSGHAISACNLLDNGRGGGAGNDRAGLAVLSAAGPIAVSGCSFSVQNESYGPNQQLYGIAATSGAPTISMGANVFTGLSQSLFITDASNLRFHETAGLLEIPHPGFRALGTINMDGRRLDSVGGLAFLGNTITSITGGVLPFGGSSLVSLNIGGGATITDFTTDLTGFPFMVVRNLNASAVTIVHNTAKIRINGGANLVLNANEGAIFIEVADGVVQHLGK